MPLYSTEKNNSSSPTLANWITVTSDYTAKAGDFILADTSNNSSFTLTLPSQPSIGQEITIIKLSNNPLTINTNNQSVKGYPISFLTYFSNQQLFKLVFVNTVLGWMPTPDDLHTQAIACTYASDGDANGIFYHLGLNGGTTWDNPYTSAVINMSASSLYDQYNNYFDQAVDRSNGYLLATANHINSWVQFDLKSSLLKINYYSLKARTNYPQLNVNWKLQGSNDTLIWIDLDSQSNNELSNGQWFSKSITNQNNIYRYFRVLQTGLNSSGDNILTLGQLELYGTLYPKLQEIHK